MLHVGRARIFLAFRVDCGDHGEAAGHFWTDTEGGHRLEEYGGVVLGRWTSRSKRAGFARPCSQTVGT